MEDIDKLYIAEQIALDVNDIKVFGAFIATLIDDWHDVHGLTYDDALAFTKNIYRLKEEVRDKLKEVDRWYR